jgi:hypothetical protein
LARQSPAASPAPSWGSPETALEDLDHRRLAGAVRAEQREHHAAHDREVDAGDRVESP